MGPSLVVDGGAGVWGWWVRPQGSSTLKSHYLVARLSSKGADSCYLQGFCFAEWFMQMRGQPGGSG